MNRFLSLTLLALAFSSVATARTWYISNSGSNSNDGLSKEKPFASFDYVNSESANGTLEPYDSILLKGGDTFVGTLLMYNPVNMYIGSYGEGRATIKGPRAVLMNNSIGSTVENLIGIAYGAPLYYDGFEFAMYGGDLVIGLPHTAKINNVSSTGFGVRGIAILATELMDLVIVTNCTANNNGWDGISVFGTFESHNMKNVLISNCTAIGNYGSAQRMDWPTGNGISVMYADQVLIEKCEVGANGGNGSHLSSGNSGIYLSDVINSRIDSCYSSRNKGNDTFNIDGNGIQLNGGCSNDTIQNCDFSQNHGAAIKLSDDGVSLFQTENLLIRNNTSFDDGTWRYATFMFEYDQTATTSKNIFFDHNTVTQSIRNGYVFSSFTTKIQGLKFDSTSICLANYAHEYTQQPPAYVSITNTIYPCLIMAIPTTRPAPTQTDKTKISMYPNPILNILNVEMTKQIHPSQLQIFNSTGQHILTKRMITGQNLIDLSNLAAGFYLAVVRNDYRVIYTQKLLKQ